MKTAELRPLVIGAQLWICKGCGLVRQWGELDPPEISNEMVRLRCEHCGDLQLHFYGGVYHGQGK